MKILTLVLAGILSFLNIFSQTFKQEFISTDIYNFWNAYDRIITTKDSLLQQQYLKEFYIDKASAGLEALIRSRNYTPNEFLNYINNASAFWKSIRTNILNVNILYPEIENDIQKLNNFYPELKPVPIYFSIGAFRTGGTAYENMILIGSELSLADKNTVIHELPEWRQPFYKEYTPIEEIALLCTHEYIHTQQKELVHNLISKCLYEGIAEFVSCEATGKKSSVPAIAFGKVNQQQVITQFVKDLFLRYNDNSWLWGENRNHLKVRDLGYYIGYEIAERYYKQANDKQIAVKELIELDYSNESRIAGIVDQSGLLPETLANLKRDFELQRPEIISTTPSIDKHVKVEVSLNQITLNFSEPMDACCRNFDFGPLGEEHSPRIQRVIGWSEDKKSFSVEIAPLRPAHHYQLNIYNFRSLKGLPSKPFLLEFETK